MKKKKTNDVMDNNTARKIKEKFRAVLSPDIVRHLKPYMSEECPVGRIKNSEDFRHLARKVCD